MKVHVSKFIDVEFMDIVFLVWAEGQADRPLAKLNSLEMKKFVDECHHMYDMPVSAEEQLRQRKSAMDG